MNNFILYIILVVFAGFSADALKDRIVDCNSKFLFVCDEGKRGIINNNIYLLFICVIQTYIIDSN